MCLVHRVGIHFAGKWTLHSTPLLEICENFYMGFFHPCYTACAEEEKQEAFMDNSQEARALLTGPGNSDSLDIAVWLPSRLMHACCDVP